MLSKTIRPEAHPRLTCGNPLLQRYLLCRCLIRRWLKCAAGPRFPFGYPLHCRKHLPASKRFEARHRKISTTCRSTMTRTSETLDLQDSFPRRKTSLRSFPIPERLTLQVEKRECSGPLPAADPARRQICGGNRTE